MGILNIVLLVLAILFLLVGLFFFLRAVFTRRSVADRAYGVERQEARLGIRLNVTRGAFFLILGLIALAIFGLVPESDSEAPIATITPAASPTVQATQIKQPTSTSTRLLETLTATATVPSRTPFPTDTPEPTNTPVLPSAVVISPNGLWLREAPGGSQELELVPDGAILILLPGRETVDDLEWQEVRTQAGNVGWVAVEFVEYQQ